MIFTGNPCGGLHDKNLSGWFDDLKTVVGGGYDYATKNLNLPKPLDQEISKLRIGRDIVKRSMFRTTAMLQKELQAIHNSPGMNGPRTASLLQQEGDNAYSKGRIVVGYYANAIIAGQATQATIDAKRPSARLAADFFAKKTLAEREGDAANARFDKFYSNFADARKIVSGPSVIGRVALIPGQTFTDMRTIFKPMIPTTDTLKTVTKNLPLILGGFALLYTLSIAAPIISAARKR